MKHDKFYTTILSVLYGAVLIAPFAQADDFDRGGIRGETYCFPDKYVTKMVDRLSRVKPSKRDVVDIALDPKFLILDGGNLPDRYFLKMQDGTETNFTVLDTGHVPNFFEVINAQGVLRGKNDICIQDKARIGRSNDDEGLYFEMGLTPFFKDRSGEYSIALLREGTKDGKRIYKCMIPSVARLLMPDTDHISVRYESGDASPQISAIKNGVSVSVPVEFHNEAYVFDLSPLRKAGVQTLLIEGGSHSLTPVPSVKTMRRYGLGAKNVTTKIEP